MKKIFILLLCVFSLLIGYSQSFKTVKIGVPSKIMIKSDTVQTVTLTDSTYLKYLNIYVKDSVLHIGCPHYLEVFKSTPAKIRISTPDSIELITDRNFKIIR